MMFYDNNTDYKSQVRDYWNGNLKKFRIVTIILGIVLLALGVLNLFFPIRSMVVMAYVMAVVMIVTGIGRIVEYAKMPSYMRTGLWLLNGVLDLLLGVMLVFSSKETMLFTLSFFFAFDLVVSGIESLTLGSHAKFFGFENSGSFTAGGVINIIVGIILLLMPGASLITLSVLITVFFITRGVVLIGSGIRAGKLKA
ncbi:MAG: DUF308 domain-containing protein [Eubacterium sp.]|jgi:uncharacterized membrane protein HdeD (DUF308 family)